VFVLPCGLEALGGVYRHYSLHCTRRAAPRAGGPSGATAATGRRGATVTGRLWATPRVHRGSTRLARAPADIRNNISR
jgi:hypothetical protein